MNRDIKENITIELPILSFSDYDFSEFFSNMLENIKGNSIVLRNEEIGVIDDAYIKGDYIIVKGGLYNFYVSLEGGHINPYKDKTKNKIQYRFKYKKGKILK